MNENSSENHIKSSSITEEDNEVVMNNLILDENSIDISSPLGIDNLPAKNENSFDINSLMGNVNSLLNSGNTFDLNSLLGNSSHLLNNGNTFDLSSLKGDGSPLLNSGNTLDMNSIMKMATTLLKDDSLMNSVKGLGKLAQDSVENQSKLSEGKDLEILNSLTEKMEKMVDCLSDIKYELRKLSKYNKSLVELVEKSYKKDKK